MFAKFIDEDSVEFPPYEKDGIINYNSDSNAEQLLKDGYLPFIKNNPSQDIETPVEKYKIENNTIISYFIEKKE